MGAKLRKLENKRTVKKFKRSRRVVEIGLREKCDGSRYRLLQDHCAKLAVQLAVVCVFGCVWETSDIVPDL